MTRHTASEEAQGAGAALATTPPEIGLEIQRRRKEAGFSLDELARRSGVSKSILSQIERNRSNPTVATVWRLCAALDHPPEKLFGSLAAAPSPIALLSANATPEILSEDGLCRLRILGAIETVDAVQWYEVVVQPQGELVSAAHGAGSSEHLTVLEGTLVVEANGDRRVVGRGETARYATTAGQHRIVNEGAGPARAMMVCAL